MGLLNNFKLGRKNEHEVNLHVDIHSGIRRIQATWTPEMAQEIEMYHNINAEEELTRLLSQELARQIDEDIIRTLTVANDLVAVQPMSAPTGGLFYFNYRYDINYFKFGR